MTLNRSRMQKKTMKKTKTKPSSVNPGGLHLKALLAKRDAMIASLQAEGMMNAEISFIFNRSIQLIQSITKKNNDRL